MEKQETRSIFLAKTVTGLCYASIVANKNNGKPVVFKLTKDSTNQFVFENPKHDFPKRIVYNLIQADSLIASIDNGRSGKKIFFNFKKLIF